MGRLLTVKQAAEKLQVTPNTIRHWLKTGRIPGRKFGRVYRVAEDELSVPTAERGPHPISHEEWTALSGEERRKRIDAVRGLLAGGTHTVDDFLAEKHAETAEQERRRDEQRRARPKGGQAA